MKTVPVAQTKPLHRKSVLLAAVVILATLISPLMASPEGDVGVYALHGFEAADKHDDNTAVANFNQAIRLYPNEATGYYYRGVFYEQRHRYPLALQDFNKALQLKPILRAAAIHRASTNQALGRYAEAMAEFDHVLKVAHDADEKLRDLNGRAWLESVCVDAHFRNGSQAVKDAREACMITGWRESTSLDTLAAAYAEANDFDSAVKYEQQAMNRLKDKEHIADFQQRLSLYQQHRPYREKGGKPLSDTASSVAPKAKAME